MLQGTGSPCCTSHCAEVSITGTLNPAPQRPTGALCPQPAPLLRPSPQAPACLPALCSALLLLVLQGPPQTLGSQAVKRPVIQPPAPALVSAGAPGEALPGRILSSGLATFARAFAIGHLTRPSAARCLTSRPSALAPQWGKALAARDSMHASALSASPHPVLRANAAHSLITPAPCELTAWALPPKTCHLVDQTPRLASSC